jgi:hypothetical protein
MNEWMMNKWTGAACLLALTAAPTAAADVRLDFYRHPESETFRHYGQMYLDGVKGGLMAYNAWMRKHGGPPAFCVPETLAMTTEQTEDIMRRSADKRSAKGDTPVALLLLWGLQDTYPCEKGGGP